MYNELCVCKKTSRFVFVEIDVKLDCVCVSVVLFFLRSSGPHAATHKLQESLAKTQVPPDVAPAQAKALPSVARPYLLASYNEDDILGVIDGNSFLA